MWAIFFLIVLIAYLLVRIRGGVDLERRYRHEFAVALLVSGFLWQYPRLGLLNALLILLIIAFFYFIFTR